MAAPIALQLYSVRETLTKEFRSTIEKIAEMGYLGVETAGFPGTTLKEAAKVFKELNLTVSAAHTALPPEKSFLEILEMMAAFGCKRIVTGKGPDDFTTIDKVKTACDFFNKAAEVVRTKGLSLGIHNHWWEFNKLNGRYIYEIMIENLAPNVFFELDTYWIKTEGVNPANIIKAIGKRAPLIHIKDGPAKRGMPHVAVGEGVIDIKSIVEAGKSTAEWLVVELDECATDMMEAVAKSYNYMISKGFARGSKK